MAKFYSTDMELLCIRNVCHQWLSAEVLVLLTVCSCQRREILNIGLTVNK
jgi:hypothetical protein